MKKIAIITSGTLPFPATKGGAVESLIQYLVNENELRHKVIFDIYSKFDKESQELSKKYKNTNCIYLKSSKTKTQIYRIFSKMTRIIKPSSHVNSLYLTKLISILRNKSYDDIVIENRVNFVLPISEALKFKPILHLHNDYLNSDILDHERIFANTKKIFTVSNFIRKRVLSVTSDINSEKVVVLKNCTDINKFTQKSVIEKELLKIKYKIPNNTKVIIFSGRINRTKGILELINSLKIVKNDRFVLLVVGSTWYGTNKKNSFLSKVKKAANDLKSKIIFTGFIGFDQMPDFYSIADLSVIPSIWDDPAPLVVFEALSAGLPIITTNSGGIPEYVCEKGSIIINRGKNFEYDLANSIDFILNNQEVAITMGLINIKHSNLFTAQKYYEDFIGLIYDK